MHQIRFSFSKKFRLSHCNHFKKIFQKSIKLSIYNMIVLSTKNHLSHPRLGIIISKKVSKSSCKRNTIKRFIRESFRLSQNYLYNMDYIVLVRPKIMYYKRCLLIKNIKLLWMYYYQ
ncbi:ribonuclease P protein component [Buchnera aphidicola]|uniref:ribonuclease P protein component n=1 Tax=Buchnera aphidicola TaxID=9 RepID=UPI0034638933